MQDEREDDLSLDEALSAGEARMKRARALSESQKSGAFWVGFFERNETVYQGSLF